ncbi:MAG: aminotransferase class IV [Clostridia bacterium]|nr:aminotransferase class IV [Clostridia bacterium]
MENLGYYNGKIGLLEDMQVPMLDRACYFGDGVYDATCAHNHVIYSLEEHIDRFFNSAKLLDINIPHTKAELSEILKDLVKKVDSGDQFVYWQVTRGTAIRNHQFGQSNFKGNIWVMLTPAAPANTYVKVKLATEKDTRFYHCNIKTLNLIPSVMASEKARLAGVDETVLYREGGRVTECAHSNISILKDGVFRTAPLDCLILPGIARKHLIKMCGQLNIPVDETPFYLDDLMNADEVIVSSSSNFCLQATEIDGKPVGGKAPTLLAALQKALVDDYEAYCGK